MKKWKQEIKGGKFQTPGKNEFSASSKVTQVRGFYWTIQYFQLMRQYLYSAKRLSEGKKRKDRPKTQQLKYKTVSTMVSKFLEYPSSPTWQKPIRNVSNRPLKNFNFFDVSEFPKNSIFHLKSWQRCHEAIESIKILAWMLIPVTHKNPRQRAIKSLERSIR